MGRQAGLNMEPVVQLTGLTQAQLTSGWLTGNARANLARACERSTFAKLRITSMLFSAFPFCWCSSMPGLRMRVRKPNRFLAAVFKETSRSEMAHGIDISDALEICLSVGSLILPI